MNEPGMHESGMRHTKSGEGAGVAIVTGGARRIGAAIVEALAEAGYTVCIHYNASAGEAEALAARICADGGDAFTHCADLSDPDAREGLVAAATSAAGSAAPLRLLVNNASRFTYDRAADFDYEEYRRIRSVNLDAPIHLSTLFHGALADRPREGCIIHVTDQKTDNLNTDFYSYTLSKLALANSVEMLARSFAPRCRVNAVSPGLTLVSGHQSPDQFAAVHPRMPLARGTDPRDIAAAVLYLASADAVTGVSLPVDCGQRLVAMDRDIMFMDPDGTSGGGGEGA